MGDPVTQACAQAVGAGVVPLSDAINESYKTLKRQYDYVRKLERNFSLLEEAEQDLCDKDEDVRRVIELNAPRRETTNQAQTWLQKVLAQKSEITLVKESYDARTKCSCAMCPFWPLRRLGERVVRQTARIRDLLGKVPNNENEIVIGREAERVELTDSRKIVVLESLNENVEELLRNLNDPRKKRIGIWGEEGIGKTTILKSLIKVLENKPDMFDMIIMVKVGKEQNISAIQKDIAGRLKLDVEGIDTENQVARTISEALAKRKYLLVLDDVFSKLNLDDVGICEHLQQGKLVMACRSRFVLDEMDLNEDIKVKGLSQKDIRVLFRKLVGPDTFDRPQIKGIAERVAKECGCCPQVIKAIASRLKGVHNVWMWEGILSKLKSPTGDLLGEMQDMVNALGVVYDELTEDGKKCLKYGAVFPEGYEMYQDYLIECWKAQNCLKEVKTMKRAREEGYIVLQDLIRHCLLEEDKTEKHVKMSLICRMMARRKYQKNELLVGEEDEQHPSKEQFWEQAQMISLICTNLQDSHLPESPKCTNISTLLLQKNEELKNIPCEFFRQMPQLQVLDLYSTGIASLPSVSNLSNIKALYLNHCPVVGLPDEIQKLKNLEVLDIRGTGIRSFPTEVGAMSSLRCLRVSFACCMGNLNHVIGPSQPVPNYLQAGGLSLLEELVVDVDPRDPNCKELLNQIATGVVGEAILHNVAIEIASLTKLTSLCFYFPSFGCFETFIRKSSRPVGRLVDNYRSFQIQVGHLTEHHNRHQLDIAGCSDRRKFRYSAGRDASGSPPTSITEVLKHACSFELIGHQDIQSLSELGNDALEGLEVCIIEECIRMKTILMGGGNQIEVPVLKYLKKLHLSGLHSLYCIWEGPIVQGSLAELTTLTLSDCPKIEKILSWEMAKQLPQLEHLRVENCPRVVELIEADQSAQTNPMGISSQNPHNQSTHTTPASTPSQAPANQPPQRNQVGSKGCAKFFQCIGLPRSVTTNQVRMLSQAPPNQSTHTNQNGTLSNAPPNQSPKTNRVVTSSLASPNRSTQATQVGSLSQAPHNPFPHANQASTSSQASPNPSPHANQASTSSKSPANQSTQTTPAGTSSLAPANQLPPTNHASTSSQAPPKQSPQKNQPTTLFQSPHNQLSQATSTANLLQAHLNQSPQNNHIGTSSQAPCTLQLKMKLMTLELINLPVLVSIYGGNTNQLSTSSQGPPNQPSQTIQAPPIDILEWTYLKKLQISDCTQLQDLSLTTTNAPCLKSIECDEGWWRGLNFHDEELKSKLEALCLFQ